MYRIQDVGHNIDKSYIKIYGGALDFLLTAFLVFRGCFVTAPFYIGVNGISNVFVLKY